MQLVIYEYVYFTCPLVCADGLANDDCRPDDMCIQLPARLQKLSLPRDMADAVRRMLSREPLQRPTPQLLSLVLPLSLANST